jgi:G3E family GTPase
VRTGAEADHGHHHEHAHDHEHSTGESRHGDTVLREVGLVLLRAGTGGEEGISALLEQARRCFAEPGTRVAPNGSLQAQRHLRLDVTTGMSYTWPVAQAGDWVAFCEHAAEEFGWSVASHAPRAQRSFGSHHHESEIASIGIYDTRALHPDKTNEWLSYLLQSRGQDILRMKGVLNFRDEPRRYVFHGVHMVFDGALGKPWGNAERANRLVFIGKDLDRGELEAGFASCVA